MEDQFDVEAAFTRSKELFARLDPEHAWVAAEIAGSSFKAGYQRGAETVARLLA